MSDQQRKGADDRTGKYGGDDGALEHERADIVTGEDSGLTGTPTKKPATSGATQAERKQADDLAKGEENPS